MTVLGTMTLIMKLTIYQDEMSVDLPRENTVVTTTEKHQKPCRGSARVIDARYSEAMSILMADGLSAPESVKAVYTIDTVVWGQVRFLPLHLDKHYINMSRMLKKLSAKEHSDITDNAIFS